VDRSGNDRADSIALSASKASPVQWTIRIALFVSWAAFFASFFLPAINIVNSINPIANRTPGTDLFGWQTIEALPLMLDFGAVLFVPGLLVIFPVMLVANVVAVFAPLALIDDLAAMIIAGCLVCGAVGTLILPSDLIGAAYLGYYVWLGSLLSLAILSACCGMYGATH
jgi:hypothetical protein